MHKFTRIFYLIFIYTVLSGIQSYSQNSLSENLSLGVMTFNIRLDTREDGKNAWPYRKAAVIEMLQNTHPAIIGFQEVLHHQVEEIAKGLRGYVHFGVGRDDGKQGGEYCPIFFDSKVFSLIDSKTLWLSETPDLPGSLGWDAGCKRLVSVVLLKEKSSGKELYVLNTHFDHQGEKARIESAKMISRLYQEMIQNAPVILLGDLNASSETEIYRILTEQSSLKDAQTIAERKDEVDNCTFTGFDGDSCEHIDFIWMPQNAKVNLYKIILNQTPQGWLSDHRPIYCKIEL